MEHVGRQRSGEVKLCVRLEAPGDGGTVGKRRLADHRLLEMAEITPVRVQVTLGSVGERSCGGTLAGVACVRYPAEDAHPARSPGSNPEGQPGLRDRRA